MKSVLIIGANGFLGIELMNTFQKKYKIIGSDINFENVPSEFQGPKIDITNESDTIQKIKEINPDIIIISAAMTDVDLCEKEKEKAYSINALGPKHVASAASEVNAKMVYLSTDFVFDGEKGNYSEEDTPNPISHYGFTKLKGEEFVKSICKDYLICRTSVLYGWLNGKVHDNFFTWAYNKLKQNVPLKIVTNQINNPTYVKDLANVIFLLVEKNATGIFHTVGRDPVSRFDFVVKIKNKFFPDSIVEPLDDLKQIARRPKNASLSCRKLESLLGQVIHSINDILSILDSELPH